MAVNFLLFYNYIMREVFKLLSVLMFIFVSIPVYAILPAEKKQEIVALYNSNNLDEAYAQISKVTENDRDYELWYLLANISQDKGNSTNAVFFLQKSIKLNNNFDKAHYNLGNIYLEEKRYNLAIEQYKQAIKVKKDFAFYYYNLGCAYLGLKEYKSAKNFFEKAIKLKSDEADFHYNLAFAYKNLNNEKEMKKELETYKNLKENNS